MRCLVTGASGFLGSHLIARLVREGHEVTAFLRNGPKAENLERTCPGIRIVHGSFSHLDNLQHALADEPIDITFHLAWQGVTAEFRNENQQLAQNVAGSLALLELVRNARCKAWIGLGSQAEYGLHSGPLHEDLPTKPVTAYGAGKLATAILSEQLCRMSGMRFVWLRLLSTYGPGDDPRHMVPMVISTLLDRKKPAVTLGEQLWDFLYVDDVIGAMYAAAVSDAGGTYNLCSGSPSRLRSIIEKIRDYIDPDLPVGFGEVPYRHDQVMHLEGDNTRLRSATGWAPRTRLDEGLARTIEWHRRKKEHAAAN